MANLFQYSQRVGHNMHVKIGNYPKHRFYHNWLYALGWTNDAKVNVRIDPWDTWSMDSTLALIIAPMLEQLRDSTHGAPIVADIDRPEHLIGTVADTSKGDVDEFHFEAWDWVLTEMLFAFASKHSGDDWESEASQKRITNGFRLFGKYYEGLWD
jgi:hypothetical protein